MDTVGAIIRRRRTEQGYTLEAVALAIAIVKGLLSNIERGIRSATREQIQKLAAYLHTPEEDLIVPWLSAQVIGKIGKEPYALQALQLAEEEVKYNQQSRVRRKK